MKTISVGFSKAGSKWALLSTAIMWIENSPFSHTYVRFNWPAAETDLIYQASKTSVNFETVRMFTSHAIIVAEFHITLSDESWKNVAKYIVQNLGKPYSPKQILGMAVKYLASKFNKSIKNPFKNGHDKFICSELMTGLLKEAGVPVNMDEENIGPVDLFNFLQKEF